MTPPVTMAAQASIATGTPPVRHGIPGNRWYDRTEARLYDYMNTTGISCTYGFSIFGGQNCLAGLGPGTFRCRPCMKPLRPMGSIA